MGSHWKRQNGHTGGYGIYYDQIPGAVISQSRNVFPTFLPVDLAGAISLNPTTVSGNRVLGFIRRVLWVSFKRER